MKLDRNVNQTRRGKYALINLRKNIVEWGDVGDSNEFFVIKLKDRYAKGALRGYVAALALELEELTAEALEVGGSAQVMIMKEVLDLKEWKDEVAALAERSGSAHPECKRPD